MIKAKAMISLNSIIVVSESAVASRLGDGIAILDLRKGTYYSLNSISSYIWRYIEEPRTVSDIIEQIMAAYDVGQEQCKQDLFILLEKLDARNPIEIKND